MSLCLFELFRRDLNEAKAVSCSVVKLFNLIDKHISSAALFVMTLRLRLKFRVTSLTINSHLGREGEKRFFSLLKHGRYET